MLKQQNSQNPFFTGAPKNNFLLNALKTVLGYPQHF